MYVSYKHINTELCVLYVHLCVSVCICSTGTWKVVSKFNTNLKQTFEAEFEVKEYGEFV